MNIIVRQANSETRLTGVNQIIIDNIDESDRILNRGDNNYIINSREPIVDQSTLFGYDLRCSDLVKFDVNDKSYQSIKFRNGLHEVYTLMSKSDILAKTKMNVSEDRLYEKGFMYYDDLGLSIQGADSRRTLKEIIRLCQIQQLSLKLSIKLKNNRTVRFTL
jgi:hypothetical protein